MSTPYYQDEHVMLFVGDWRELIPTDFTADLILTDPPYGIAHPTDYKSRKRAALAACRDYPLVHGDDEPFDPSTIRDPLPQPLLSWRRLGIVAALA